MIRRRHLKRRRFEPRRPKADEPRVKGRPAVSVAVWRTLGAELRERCGWRCEVPWCRLSAAQAGRLDPHHVLPASLGGSDHVDNVLLVCPACHARFDAPFLAGKYVAEVLGGERFRIALEFRDDKRAPLIKRLSLGPVDYTRPERTP